MTIEELDRYIARHEELAEKHEARVKQLKAERDQLKGLFQTSSGVEVFLAASPKNGCVYIEMGNKAHTYIEVDLARTIHEYFGRMIDDAERGEAED